MISLDHFDLKLTMDIAANKNIIVVEEIYSDGKFTCYRVTQNITAWIDDAWGGKRLILGWKVTPDDDGRLDAERTNGVTLYYEELVELKDIFEDGTFSRAILDSHEEGAKPKRFKLGSGKISKPSVTIRKVPVYGVMITFWKFDHFIQVGLYNVLKLLSFLDIHLKEVNDYPRDGNW